MSEENISAKTRSNHRLACCEKESVLKFDGFGAPINLNFSNGSTEYRSSLGASVNILLTLVIMLFTIQNLIVLIERSATTFTSSMLTNHYEVGHSFN